MSLFSRQIFTPNIDTVHGHAYYGSDYVVAKCFIILYNETNARHSIISDTESITLQLIKYSQKDNF